MRKALVILACATLLTGCESVGDLTSDAFAQGSATQSRFTLDSAQCQAVAETQRNYDIRGISGTHVSRHEIYNRAFATCMRANGYVRQDWSPDIAFPYNVDPTPG